MKYFFAALFVIWIFGWINELSQVYLRFELANNYSILRFNAVRRVMPFVLFLIWPYVLYLRKYR